MGLTTYQKVTAAIRQLAYGVCADATDKYVRIRETTANTSFKVFVNAIISLYSKEYLCPPNAEELNCIMKEYKVRGFPECKGSIDGMRWAWKNCPLAWSGQYKGKEKHPVVVLKAVASQNLWIWNAFFGRPGALNDTNVLNRSHLFNTFLKGEFFSKDCGT